MLPKRKLVTRQERATERCLEHIKVTPKHSKPSSPLKNTQPRELRSFARAAAAFRKSSTPSRELIARPSIRAQKRKHESEDEHSPKRSRRDLPSASRPATNSKIEHLDNGRRGSEPASHLTEENLKELERETSSNMSGRKRKRGLSRQASSSGYNPDIVSVPSQKSSASNSFYRYHILEGANMFIHPEPPPKEIGSQLDIIYKRTISDIRKRQISDTAKKKSQDFINNLRGAHREDDLVELIYEAFRELSPDEVFDCPRKADWNPSLMPDFQQEVWDPNALGQVHAAVDLASKRKQGDRSIPTPDASHSSMPPPTDPSPVALSQSRQDGAIKTPRPDFTIGLRHSTIASALIKRGLSKYKADNLLKRLQREDILCSDPTQNFLNVRFPILVIEGKAYATGKTVFEAENQAAVSGSCMINLQKQFIDLFKGVFPTSERSINLEGGKTPLAFSICTQGPIIEFWVHYFVLEEDVCMHYMNLLKLCYGSLADGLEDFLILLECLISWYKTDFLEEVADEFAFLRGASRIYVVDKVPERLAAAKKIPGCMPVDFSAGEDAVEVIIRENDGKMVDRSIDAVGYQAVGSGEGSSEVPNIVLEQCIKVTRPTGGIGVPGLYVPSDPGAVDEKSSRGMMLMSFGKLFEKGLTIGTGQCNVKKYNRYLRDMIVSGRADPSFVVSHEIGIDEAPKAYEKFDKRVEGYTKVLIHPNGPL